MELLRAKITDKSLHPTFIALYIDEAAVEFRVTTCTGLPMA